MTNKRIKGGARLRDVAAAAGVSNATVSAVVNGRAEQYGIAPATRARVEAAVRQLGYAPSPAALDMVAGRNTLVGFAFHTGQPGADRLMAALEPVLLASGFRLMVAILPREPVAAAARIGELVRFGLSGLVVWPTESVQLPPINCPLVMIGSGRAGLPAVVEDVAEGGRRLARRLLDKGHRAIAIVGDLAAQSLMVSGFMEACAQAGTTPRSFATVSAFMAEPVTVTAVCCVTPAALLEFQSRALIAGLRLGSELAVVAVADLAVAGHLVPRPTVLIPAAGLLGEAAARLLLQVMNKTAAGTIRIEPVIADAPIPVLLEKTESRIQNPEVVKQKAEVGGQKTAEVGGQKTAGGGQKSGPSIGVPSAPIPVQPAARVTPVPVPVPVPDVVVVPPPSPPPAVSREVVTPVSAPRNPPAEPAPNVPISSSETFQIAETPPLGGVSQGPTPPATTVAPELEPPPQVEQPEPVVATPPPSPAVSQETVTPVSEPGNPPAEPESNAPISSSETFQIAETPPMGDASQDPLPEAQPLTEQVSEPDPVPVVLTPSPEYVEPEVTVTPEPAPPLQVEQPEPVVATPPLSPAVSQVTVTPVSEPENPSAEPESNAPISSSETFQIAETPPLGNASQEPLPESQPLTEPVQVPEPTPPVTQGPESSPEDMPLQESVAAPPVVEEPAPIQTVSEPDPVPVVLMPSPEYIEPAVTATPEPTPPPQVEQPEPVVATPPPSPTVNQETVTSVSEPGNPPAEPESNAQISSSETFQIAETPPLSDASQQPLPEVQPLTEPVSEPDPVPVVVTQAPENGEPTETVAPELEPPLQVEQPEPVVATPPPSPTVNQESVTSVSEPGNPPAEPESNAPISSSETFQIAETPPLSDASQQPLPEAQPPAVPVQMPQPTPDIDAVPGPTPPVTQVPESPPADVSIQESVATPPVVVELDPIQPVSEPDPVPVVVMPAPEYVEPAVTVTPEPEPPPQVEQPEPVVSDPPPSPTVNQETVTSVSEPENPVAEPASNVPISSSETFQIAETPPLGAASQGPLLEVQPPATPVQVTEPTPVIEAVPEPTVTVVPDPEPPPQVQQPDPVVATPPPVLVESEPIQPVAEPDLVPVV